jgi:hypothetical protein
MSMWLKEVYEENGGMSNMFTMPYNISSIRTTYW